MLRRASEQLRYFLSAVMFLTRIPCPAWLGYEPHYLSMARWYFPVVGSLLGLLAGLVFYVCSLILPVSVALLLSIITLINITGAFHEDGLADSADGFGGAYEKAGVLRIMKDSRIGTYGTVALISALSLKFFILLELANIEPWYVLIILPIAHSYSRVFCGLFSRFFSLCSRRRRQQKQANSRRQVFKA
ncbi:MAG: adenosylcobinamide-GDP ribazoletransferase [Flavobacteriales bacterium]|jgi:adenosylcobinamide-GDP ribazoletransferase